MERESDSKVVMFEYNKPSVLLVILVDLLVEPWDAVLLQDHAGLVAFELGDLDFAEPVLVALLQLHVGAALVHVHDRVRHLVLELDDDRLLLLNVVLQLLEVAGRGLDVEHLLVLAGLLKHQVSLDVLGASVSNGEVLLELVEAQDGVGSGYLEDDELIVAIVDVLDVLLVLDL